MSKNRRVSLYYSTKVGGKWKYKKAPKRPVNLTEGNFVIFWYSGTRKMYENVGKIADVAEVAVARKELELRQCILV
jgi:hypothetical protein